MDDRQLLRACRRGEAAAWEELIHRYRRLIYSIPLAFGFGADRADDIFQRVALKLVEHVGEIRRAEGLASWIAVTTWRECLAEAELEARFAPLDAANPRRSLEGKDPALAERLEAVEREHRVALAFEQLDERCKKLLAALYVEDPTPSYKEIAERLGRPVGSLGPTRARCLAKLARLYRKLGGPVRGHPKPDRAGREGTGSARTSPGIKGGGRRSSSEGGER